MIEYLLVWGSKDEERGVERGVARGVLNFASCFGVRRTPVSLNVSNRADCQHRFRILVDRCLDPSPRGEFERINSVNRGWEKIDLRGTGRLGLEVIPEMLGVICGVSAGLEV